MGYAHSPLFVLSLRCSCFIEEMSRSKLKPPLTPILLPFRFDHGQEHRIMQNACGIHKLIPMNRLKHEIGAMEQIKQRVIISNDIDIDLVKF